MKTFSNAVLITVLVGLGVGQAPLLANYGVDESDATAHAEHRATDHGEMLHEGGMHSDKQIGLSLGFEIPATG